MGPSSFMFQGHYTTISPDFLLIFSSVLAIACSLLLFWTKHKNKSLKSKRFPPGPTRLPVIGNLHQIGNPLHTSLQHLADKHGDLMFLQLGSVPSVVISSADMVREIFRTHDQVFSSRPDLYSAKKLSYNSSGVTFSPYGEFWREVRKIAVSELLSPKRVQSFQTTRDAEVVLMLDSIARSSGPVNLSQLTLLLANNVLCRVAFGRKYDGARNNWASQIQTMLREAQDSVGRVGIADFFPSMEWLNKFNGLGKRIDKISKQLDTIYDTVIEEHLNVKRHKPEHEDLVDVLLRVQKDPSQATALSNDSVKGVLSDMFFAGTDTLAATLTWTMTELIRHPSVMKRAQEEVRSVAKGKDKVEESDLSQLEYLKLVVKESFRLHLPAPLLVPRETMEDCKIRGYEIPAKTRVFINAGAIAMDPKLWENPGEFRPERFLGRPIDFNGQQFELIPFGVGRRGCPGMNYAMLLIELALANLLHRFNWELPPGVTREDMDMDVAFGVTVHKKSPLYLVATLA